MEGAPERSGQLSRASPWAAERAPRPPGEERQSAGWGTAAGRPEGRGREVGRGQQAAGLGRAAGPSKQDLLKEINSTPRGNFDEKQEPQSQSIQKISVESFSLAHDKKL